MKNKKSFLPLIITLLPIFYGLILWTKLPVELPIHFNINGEVDRYANKVWLIIIWPIIATLLHLFLIIYRTKIVARSQNNKMHTIISWSIPLGTNILLSYIFAYGLGNHVNITSILLPTIGILFIALGNYMPKTQRNRFVGIRIPTALNNDVNWFKTQRIGGLMFVVGGFMMIGGGFLGMISEFWTIASMIVALVLITVIPIIYLIRSSHKA
ncbi:DUF1648 domain-containing protein [Leuconostoc suionicum]|uniref:DUF1648 domain-containing protein n=1 Tax=Leuconostoc suionicum TaxID=1511761 RepID=UPI0021A2ECFC|nr:SdpI family protein [Leuconostoc suionicum]MCT4377274.1 DUF1648 domain-containing protein [Leuconostoc suionicum]